jgi:hypothetical protein
MYHEFKSMLLDKEIEQSSKNIPETTKIKKEKEEVDNDWDEY